MLERKYFKSDKAFNRCAQLHPTVIEILVDALSYCRTELLDFLITETVTTPEEDLALKRVSKTHQEGRAADLAVRGWSDIAVEKFRTEFNEKYKDVAAITKNGLVLIPPVNHGSAPHIHIQIRRLG